MVLSALVAHTAWHWMLDRFQVLRQVGLPKIDADGIVIIARWVLAILMIVGGGPALGKWLDKWRENRAAAGHQAEPVPIAAPAEQRAAS